MMPVLPRVNALVGQWDVVLRMFRILVTEE